MVFRRRENISVIVVCPKGTVSQKSSVSKDLCPIGVRLHYMGCVPRSTTPLYGLCPEEYDSIIWAVSRKRAVQSVVTGVGTIFWRAGR